MKKFLPLIFLVLFSGKGFSQTTCIDSSHFNPTAICPFIFAPVCGCDGVTYGNSCEAYWYGAVNSWTSGACGTASSCNALFGFLQNQNSVSFSDSSSGSSAIVYHWDFGDGDTSAAQNPSHTYSVIGSYTCCLTITSDTCSNTYCHLIQINSTSACIDTSLIDSAAVCIAQFDPVCGCDGISYPNSCEAIVHHGVTSWTMGACSAMDSCYANWGWSLVGTPPPYIVQFHDSSSGGTVFRVWIIDNIPTYTTPNPIHTFLTCDHYICLGMNDSLGCSDTLCDSIHVCSVGISSPRFEENIFVSPNPFSNELIIQSNISFDLMEVFSIAGEKMIEGKANAPQLKIYTRDWAQGIYFVRIKAESGSRIFKIVKQDSPE